MNSFQRTMAAIRGESYDRTPVIPLIIQHALHIAGIKHSEYSTNSSKMAEAQLFSLKKYGYDGLHITTDNQIISEVLGCEINFPFDEPPNYKKRILSGKTDLKQLNIDFDPFKDGRMPVILKAAKICREELKDESFIKVNCDSGAFSVAAALRGEQLFFIDLLENEQYAFDLLEICALAVIKYALSIAENGAHGITFGDSTSGLISRELYEKFALPFQKKIISSLKNTGLPIFMHICGDTGHIIDLMAESGADVLEIDSLLDLKTAFDKTGHELCLEGNVHPTEVLLQGKPENVYDESAKCIKESKGKLLILSSGCEVPRFTPEENILAMLRASEEYSYT